MCLFWWNSWSDIIKKKHFGSSLTRGANITRATLANHAKFFHQFWNVLFILNHRNWLNRTKYLKINGRNVPDYQFLSRWVGDYVLKDKGFVQQVRNKKKYLCYFEKKKKKKEIHKKQLTLIYLFLQNYWNNLILY